MIPIAVRRLHYIGFSESTGYGIAASQMVRALRNAGFKVQFTQLKAGDPVKGGLVLQDDPGLGSTADAAIIHTVPEYFPYWYRHLKSLFPKIPVWAYTTWETSKIPDHWPSLIHQLDGLFVPSQWNRAVFTSSGGKVPIRLLPHISEFHGLSPPAKAFERINQELQQVKDHYVFYTIGVWTERKALWRMIEAFLQEFTAFEKVTLVIKTGKKDLTSFGRKAENFFRKGYGSTDSKLKDLFPARERKRIVLLTEDWTSDQIAAVHARCHCYVSCSRGEGWGMGAYEAAWFGKPVIITHFGGPLDFLPKDQAFLLPYQLVPVKGGQKQESYQPDQQWAEADLKALGHEMRAVYSRQDQASERGLALQQYVLQHFSDEQIIKQCINGLFNV